LKGTLLANHSSQGRGRLVLLQIGLFCQNEETNESPEENHLSERQDHLAHCFPVNIASVFEWNVSYNFDVSTCG
jgi:hypothetical protein